MIEEETIFLTSNLKKNIKKVLINDIGIEYDRVLVKVAEKSIFV